VSIRDTQESSSANEKAWEQSVVNQRIAYQSAGEAAGISDQLLAEWVENWAALCTEMTAKMLAGLGPQLYGRLSQKAQRRAR
jgi:hypothetical protein